MALRLVVSNVGLLLILIIQCVFPQLNSFIRIERSKPYETIFCFIPQCNLDGLKECIASYIFTVVNPDSITTPQNLCAFN